MRLQRLHDLAAKLIGSLPTFVVKIEVAGVGFGEAALGAGFALGSLQCGSAAEHVRSSQRVQQIKRVSRIGRHPGSPLPVSHGFFGAAQLDQRGHV